MSTNQLQSCVIILTNFNLYYPKESSEFPEIKVLWMILLECKIETSSIRVSLGTTQRSKFPDSEYCVETIAEDCSQAPMNRGVKPQLSASKSSGHIGSFSCP
jgi:hypothetical protein